MQSDGFPRRFTLRREHILWLVLGVILIVYLLTQVSLWSFLLSMAVLLVAITVHEAAHAWTADRLGDSTARHLGRVSLNPLVHLDPLGTAMMLLTALTGFGIGWGKPVPVSSYRLRYGSRLGVGIVALAGPLANLLLAVVAGIALRFVPRSVPIPYLVLSALTYTCIILALFNLIPVPPLDGNSVLLGLLSLSSSRWAWRVSQWVMSVQRMGPIALLLLIFVAQFLGINVIGWLIGPPSRALYGLLVGVR